MSLQMEAWPRYASPAEALRAETRNWGARLDRAYGRYDCLDGELGAAVTRLAVSIVDANEPPDQYSALRIYSEQFGDDETSAALLLVNYDTETPPERTEELLDTIRRQRDETGVQAAISLAGYDHRRFGPLKQDASDIMVAHGLRTGTELPIVGVSNDFDMASASPPYWEHMTQNEHVGRPARMWSSKVVPHTFGSPDCLVNRCIRYLFKVRELWTDITPYTLIYGASAATTADTFASTNGWVGPFLDKSKDGALEPLQLALNIQARATGRPAHNDENDYLGAIAAHAHSVPKAGFISVSTRRETVEYATFLGGDPYPMKLINTSSHNAYRRLRPDQLAELAESAPANTNRAQAEVARLERIYTKEVKGETLSVLIAALRAARQELDLPEPAAA